MASLQESLHLESEEPEGRGDQPYPQVTGTRSRVFAPSTEIHRSYIGAYGGGVLLPFSRPKRPNLF